MITTICKICNKWSHSELYPMCKSCAEKKQGKPFVEKRAKGCVKHQNKPDLALCLDCMHENGQKLWLRDK